MSEKPVETPVRMKLWLRLVLAGSLALNLLVVGMVAGAALRGSADDRRPPRLDTMSGPLTRALSEDDRRAIGRQLRAAYRENRPSLLEMRAAFRGLIDDLRAEPFDPSAVAARFEKQRAITNDRLVLGQRLLLERLTDMSASERSAFADRLESNIKRLPSGKRAHHRP